MLYQVQKKVKDSFLSFTRHHSTYNFACSGLCSNLQVAGRDSPRILLFLERVLWLIQKGNKTH
jgi:hypothetical protein